MKQMIRNLLLRTQNDKPATIAGFVVGRIPQGQNGGKVKFLSMGYSPAKIYPFDTMKDELQRQFDSGKINQATLTISVEEIPRKSLSIKKWYVLYYFENPITGKNERKRVYEDINRYHGPEKIEYAKLLRDAVNMALNAGYSPFAELAKMDFRYEREQQEWEAVVAKEAKGDRSNYTMIQAMEYFMNVCRKRRLDESTISRYLTGIRNFKNWLNDHEMLLVRARDITSENILQCLSEREIIEEWKGRTYNNHLQNMHTLFNLLAKSIHGIVDKNPIHGAETRQTVTTTHAVYSDKQLAYLMSSVRRKKDYYTEGLIMTCYYAAVRAKEEMLNFRAGNVNYERDLILLDGDYTKARREDYIPLDPELKKHFLSRGYDQIPPDYYIFGRNGEPSPVRAPYNFFSNRFKVYRKELGLDRRFTLYGLKHTRAVHLAMAGVDIYAIMSLFRHSDISITVIYLRELGATINRGATKSSRSI